MELIDELAEFAEHLARKSGDMILNALKTGFDVENKRNRYDVVTEHDRAIEKFIFDSIRARYPQHVLIGEESMSNCEAIEHDTPTWIVDPIDGTMNFVHHHPFCCVSIGLAINRELVVGVINIPQLNKLYSATKGRGSTCNGERICVSKKSKLEEALLLSELVFKSGRPSDRMKTIVEELVWKSHGMRLIGATCVGLCFIAEGLGDVYFHRGIHVWDMAAGKVLVEEAGGSIRTFTGGPFDPESEGILATSTPELADEISAVLARLP